ncbi:nuclear transport factor 2 family protein [Hwanghaeella sp.]|uniref:nuclear transport factor 2 family protein n=1 Tax=Hwanghaeella sp. TaxID=2605943 RepID=UPI003CCC23CC
MIPDFDGVTETLKTYFDGLYHSDTEMLGRVFHPQARYVCAIGDELVNLGMEEYFPVVDKTRTAGRAWRGTAGCDPVYRIRRAENRLRPRQLRDR